MSEGHTCENGLIALITLITLVILCLSLSVFPILSPSVFPILSHQGIDLQEGREGGTWFAMNPSRGKIGALLNILQPIDKVCLGKQHRGFLVPQFLDSQLDGPQFLASLIPRSSQYADFLMVTIDVRYNLIFFLSFHTF